MDKNSTITRYGKSGGVQEPPERPLGIYAKTASAMELLCSETGEVLRFVRNERTQEYEPEYDPRKVRAERFALKSVVNRLLPKSRTSKCSRWRVPQVELQIHKSVEHDRAFYSGLQVCASVWACPVCSAKISERRRVELVAAVATAKAMGLHVKLLTLTVPHGMGDDLPTLVAQIRDAWRRTSSTRAGDKVRKLIGLVGTVRALEVTHGQNGFHPHLHVLLFLDQDATDRCVQGLFTPLWQNACVKAGLPRPSDKHGCRVDDGSYAAKYASKWGLESELTKSHSKKGRKGSRSPWDLLRAVLDKSEGWERDAHLFRTYADAFHGQRQLYWSNGLREYLGMAADASEEEIVAAYQDNASHLADLTDDQWRAILRTKSESIVLDMAEEHPEALPVLLASILERSRRTTSGKPGAVSGVLSGAKPTEPAPGIPVT